MNALRHLLLFIALFPGPVEVQAQTKGPAPPVQSTPSIFVRDTAPESETVMERKFALPPGQRIEGKPPDAESSYTKLETWAHRDGRRIRFRFRSWFWEKSEKPDGSQQWVVMLRVVPEGKNDEVVVRADTLSPAENAHLLSRLWGYYNYQVGFRRREEALFKESAGWLDRIATYTGDEPRPGQEKGMPPRMAPEMTVAPDIRIVKKWPLTGLNPSAPAVGEFSIIDWAVEEPVQDFSEHRYRINYPWQRMPVRIAFADGKIRVISYGTIDMMGTSSSYIPAICALWKDWRALAAAGGNIPNKEGKMKALASTLPQWWQWAHQADPPEQRKGWNDAHRTEVSPLYCYGVTLAFPGAAPAGFQPVDLAAPVRASIPVVDQGPLGSRASDCLPSSIATFFLWWDDQKFVPLDRKGDIETRADWLHSQLAREMRTLNNRGTGWDQVTKGLADFSKRHLDNRYCFQLNHDFDYAPANVARYVQGGEATILTLTLWKGKRESGTHAVPVIEATADGWITIATWGMRLRGQWKEVNLPASTGNTSHIQRAGKILPRYELSLTGLSDSDREKLDAMRFILDFANSNSITAITPYVRKDAAAKPK